MLIRRSLPTAPNDRDSKSPFFAELERQGLTPSREMIFVGREPGVEDITSRLGLAAGSEVIARRKKLMADDVPVRIATSYFSPALFPEGGLDVGEFIMPTLQSEIRSAGHEFGHADEILRPRPATESEIEQFGCESDEWVVEILRTSYDTAETPVHVLQTVCLASLHEFDIVQPKDRDAF